MDEARVLKDATDKETQREMQEQEGEVVSGREDGEDRKEQPEEVGVVCADVRLKIKALDIELHKSSR